MRFNVSRLLQEPIGAVRIYDMDEEGPVIYEGGRPCFARGEVSLLRTHRGILVEGRLDLTFEDECSRCLAKFTQELSVDLADEFLPSIDVHTGLPLGRDEDEDGDVFYISQIHELDLAEAVRQYALTAEPMKALCRPDCAGICPGCGADLNREACRCVGARETDSGETSVRIVAAGHQRRQKLN